ncbi:ATP-dependent Clp protease ATP-binding subunit (plasmid) [Acaryochloris sp. 'Moss Beach']|uniref:ATP-dependent Clp protease ATP-binding subunit n=1 Tax=Acaryochloris sp. 'Moss Beach' TaxID=2740837 RepID=UPI001F43ABA5|nr:ATP-dependent Clp protease ATP-binding subunit [Acaryochloris sp. 'Moss Beach']UJB73273.1 ATP-dependent Clp protease ATP-binding subunit [Acaryochloris sp. 'Moss Beach']
MFECFTEKAIKAITLAQEEARHLKQTCVGTELILLGIIAEGTGIAAKVLNSLGANLEEVRIEVEKLGVSGTSSVEKVDIPFTPRSKRVLELALEESQQLGHNYVSTEHLLLGLTKDEQSIAVQILVNLEIDFIDIRTQVMQMLYKPIALPSSRRPSKLGNQNLKKTPILDDVGTDLTQLAIEGNLDPVVGRQKEVQRMIQILSRRRKNNPILIGEPGVGKTALAEGLAQRIINHDVPETLEGKRILTLNVGSLLAGTKYRGEFEERLKAIVEEVRSNGDVILVIDEIHTLVGAGAGEGGLDAANILKPSLARGELQCIGATTLDDYRQNIERDPALERRFQPVMVDESSVEETIQILQGLRSCYEQHHQLEISDLALEAAAKLSDRYICDRFLPDKAIDLIDEAGSRVRISHSKSSPADKELNQELRQILKDKGTATQKQDYSLAGELRIREVEIQKKIQSASQTGFSMSTVPISLIVKEDDIAHIVASWTGIPLHKLTESESENLLQIEDILHQRIIGQEEAVKAISRAIRRVRTGLKDPNRPIASFIFSGPTGVGKTELAKVLASSYFGSEAAMIRLDMSEYMEGHTVSKLIGSPPGYVGFNEGGQLTEAVRRKPYTVLLFDEIEKAHPDIFNLLLQVLEDGRLTDAKGRTIDFKNTLLIMTSNIGSKVVQKGGSGLGFEFSADQGAAQYSRMVSIVNEELKQFFRPEFLNRLDEIIVFQQLNKTEVKQIADILLQEVCIRLAEQEITLEVTDLFKERLVDVGYDPEMGARPLRRAITHLLEDCLAEEILTSRVKAGDEIVMDIDEVGQTKVLIKQTEKSD